MKKSPASIEENANASAKQTRADSANAAANIFHSKPTENPATTKKEKQTMNTKQHAAMMEQIEAHGRNLLAIFPNAAERDPIALCKKLRRLEAKAQAIGLRLCNGPEYANENEPDQACAAILAKVNAILGNARNAVPVFINRDPRGYALKIDDEAIRELRAHGKPIHSDWGGYGILAPDFTPAEND